MDSTTSMMSCVLPRAEMNMIRVTPPIPVKAFIKITKLRVMIQQEPDYFGANE